MAQYHVPKLDPSVRHIRRNCPDILKAIEDGKITKADVIPFTDETLAAHRKQYGNGMGDDGFPVEAGRCTTCWNIKTTRSAKTPNERERERLVRINERAEAKAAKEAAEAQKAAEKAAKAVESTEKEPVAAGTTKPKGRQAVTRK